MDRTHVLDSSGLWPTTERYLSLSNSNRKCWAFSPRVEPSCYFKPGGGYQPSASILSNRSTKSNSLMNEQTNTEEVSPAHGGDGFSKIRPSYRPSTFSRPLISGSRGIPARHLKPNKPEHERQPLIYSPHTRDEPRSRWNRKRRVFGPRFLTSYYFKLGGGVLTRHPKSIKPFRERHTPGLSPLSCPKNRELDHPDRAQTVHERRQPA